MRVGLIAPPWIPVPPPAYGGTEAVVDNLARGLVALGHTDIIHDHTELGPLLAGRHGLARQPVVTTIHGPFTPQADGRLAGVARYASIVAISHAHARCFGEVPVAAVIHHGIDLDLHKPGPGTGG